MIRPAPLGLAGLILSLATPAVAGDIHLGWPLDCTLGQSCYIQNYVDHDATPAARDFTCGALSYDGHQGTDIALPSLAAMRAGVTVRAAAPGKVLATRDGMADIAFNAPDAPEITDRDCGNGVLMDNGDGWQTQFCHMKSGSIAVHKGETLAEGAALGQVGLSGRTEFPHLHVTLRHDGKVTDPFDPDEATSCGTPPSHTLWQNPVPYAPGGLIGIGLTTAVPTFEAIHDGLPTPPTLTPDAPALVLWANAYGSRPGDVLSLKITGPSGPVVQAKVALERAQATLFRAAGRKRPATGWPPGPYSAEARMLRGAEVLGHATTTLIITP